MKRLACMAVLTLLVVVGQALAQSPMIPNGGFEQGLDSWVAWGDRADLIGIDSAVAHSGSNSARIGAGHNALYVSVPMDPSKAYEIRFFYRMEGKTPGGAVALSYYKKNGTHRSAGFREISLAPGKPGWTELREVFMPTPTTASCQIAFSASGDATLWVDDVSLKVVPRPADLRQPPDPWEGMKHRTQKPLFKELLTKLPGGYTVVSWAHNLNRENLPEDRKKDFPDEGSWSAQVERTFEESSKAGMGYMDLPGRLNATERWRTEAFHAEQARKYGVRYDVWTEGSPSIAAGLKNGAELMNPMEKDRGSRPALSWVDPKYVEAQKEILVKLGKQLRGKPFVGVYYGKDEPSIRLPQGPPDQWGPHSRQMAEEVRQKYGFEIPRPGDPSFEKDPNKYLRWIAFNRWAADRFAETRCELHAALRQADPKARYSPADYWFMSGFVPYDFPRMAECSEIMELDPYGSSAERRQGRGVYNHGFGAKFMSDMTGKPVRIIAQAFDYAGYTMNPQDLREWVSQAMRCGASAISYYTMDNPQYRAPDRWKMMLHLSKVITRMNRIAIPNDPDTAVLYTWYTHMSQGRSTGGDQIYAAHALVGEMAGSWYRFIADSQLERHQRSLKGYKAVYLPLARYMTAEATQQIERYVRNGGTLVCGDADAFASDPSGKDTRAARERILGIRTIGPKKAHKIMTRPGAFGLKAGASLPLFDISLWDESSPGRAREIQVLDKRAEILATYPDGKPAIVSRKLGRGRAITFAANPFMPQLTVEKTAWPTLFKGLQESLGCKTERNIWRFCLPDMGENG